MNLGDNRSNVRVVNPNTARKEGTMAKQTAAPAAPVKVKVDKPAKEKKAKKERKAFDLATAVGTDGKVIALDERGRLTAVPTNVPVGSKPLTGKAFAKRSDFFRYRAAALNNDIAKVQARQAYWLEKATEADQGVDPKKAKVRKVEKLRKALAELEAQLKSEGVQV